MPGTGLRSYGKISRPSPSTRFGLSLNCTTCQATVAFLTFAAPAARVNRRLVVEVSAAFHEVSSRFENGFAGAGSPITEIKGTLLLIAIAEGRTAFMVTLA